MQQLVVKKSQLKGEITIPSSKSHTLRAILFAALANGLSTITQYLHSPDTDAMIQACRTLGAKIEITPDALFIEGVDGKIQGENQVIDAGNSGIVLRFITTIAALGSKSIQVTGDHSIREQRPMQPLLSALNQLGVKALSTRANGFAPLTVHGPILGGKASLDGIDSQPVSALLIAAAFAQAPIEIQVKNPGEKPWIDLTLFWLDRMQIAYERRDYTFYRLTGNHQLQGFNYSVPGDWSSAAFPIVAALITQSELLIHNLDIEDIQGDKKVISILQAMGANIEINVRDKTLHVKKSGALQGGVIDVNDCIDALPILSTLACYMEGETHLVNAAIARHKESDRLRCMTLELKKMGAEIEESIDSLRIRPTELKGASLYAHQDHRIAMALAVAGLAAKGDTQISGSESISKTYPSFVEHFQQMGAAIRLLGVGPRKKVPPFLSK